MSDIDALSGVTKGQVLPLQRDVEAISIPFGKTETLPEDSEVTVMQAKAERSAWARGAHVPDRGQ